MTMKRSLIATLMLAPMLTFAQQKYTLQVQIGHLENPGIAYLSYQNAGKQVQDSAVLSNGTYTFKGNVAEPAFAQLSIRKNGATFKDKTLLSTPVWLEQAAIKVTSTDPAVKVSITGGQLNKDYQALQERKTETFAKMAAASKKFMAATEEEKKKPDFMKNHNSVFKAAMAEAAGKDSIYIKTHPDSYLSLYLLSGMISGASAHKVLEPGYKSLSKSLQQTYAGKELFKTIQKLKVKTVDGKVVDFSMRDRQIGETALDFTLNNSSDKPVSLSSFNGKYVLIDFWASWCVPCRKENPNVKAAYEKFKDKNFTIISISIDNTLSKDKWLAAVAKDGLTWTQLWDLDNTAQRVSDIYGVKTIPQNFLIGPDGKILAKGLREEGLQQKLAEILH